MVADPAGSLLVAAALALAMLLPRNIVVPDLVGARATFDAEQTLTEAGLEFDPEKTTRADTTARPGTEAIVDQDPARGGRRGGREKVEKGSPVTIVLATGSGKTTCRISPA